MRRLRGVLSLFIVVATETVALMAFRRVTHVATWRVDWTHVWRWMDVTPSTDVTIGLAAWAGMVISGWLVASTLLYLVASVARVPVLIRATSALTLPGVRRVVERAAAAGLAAAVILPAGAAFAQTTAPTVAAPVAVTAAPAPSPVAAPVATDQAVTSIAGHRTVVAGDNFWDLAADEAAAQLGRAPTNDEIVPYWRDMIAASQPMQVGDPNLIFPGERVAVPVIPGAVGAPVLDEAAPLVTPAPAAVSAPAPAVPAPAPAVPAPAVPATVPAVPAPAAPIATPSTVAVATTVAAPTRPADAPAARADSDASTPLAGDTGTTTAPQIKAAQASSTAPAQSGSTVWVGGALLAAGVLGLANHLRRRNNRLRRPGEILVPLGPAAAQVDMELRLAADMEAAEFVDTALRALSGMTWDRDDPPSPLGFVLGADQLDIVLAEAAVAPLPFRGRGTHWTISTATDLGQLEELAGDRPMPLPAVITLGRNADGGEVVVDLEDAGMLSLVGDGADGIVRAAALQLATAPWTQMVDVILVGFDPIPGRPAVRSVASLADVIEELESQAVRTAEILVDCGCSSTFEARLRGVADDTWVPTVVVCAAPPPDHLARRLVGLVGSAEAAGIAALTAGPIPESPWQLKAAHGGIALDTFGTTVVLPQTASVRDAGDIRAMLDLAAQAPVDAPVVSAAPEVQPTDLIVDVYGPVRVDGMAFERGKALEILVYLACHRSDHVDGDRIMEAMWPGGDPLTTRGTLNTTMFYVRQQAGEHVPRLRGGEKLYAVVNTATSVQLLDAALRSARQPGPAAMAQLHDALSRIQGRPFDSPQRAGHGGGRAQTAYEWAFGENYVDQAVRVAGDAAHRLVDLALEAGDVGEARWAIRQGLLADPDSEALRRDEMRAAGAAQDREGVEAAMDAVIAAARRDDDDAPSPVTTATYVAAQAMAG